MAAPTSYRRPSSNNAGPAMEQPLPAHDRPPWKNWPTRRMVRMDFASYGEELTVPRDATAGSALRWPRSPGALPDHRALTFVVAHGPHLTEQPSADDLELRAPAPCWGHERRDRGRARSRGGGVPAIEALVDAVHGRMARGKTILPGRRNQRAAGHLDASECPPPPVYPWVGRGPDAGGDGAIRKAVSSPRTIRVGMEGQGAPHRQGRQRGGHRGSGTLRDVGALGHSTNGVLTGCITCKPRQPVASVPPGEVVVVGPGSSRKHRA